MIYITKIDNMNLVGRLPRFHLLVRDILLLWLVTLSWQSASGQSCDTEIAELNWDQMYWEPGIRGQWMRLPFGDGPDSVDVVIEIETAAKGSFEAYDAVTPYVDGGNEAHFGNQTDLGIMFDPAAGQRRSPVVIKLKFDQPVHCVQFEISDIDVADGRRDSVVVFGNDSTLIPNLAEVSSTSTARTSGNYAVAKGGESGSRRVGSAYRNEDYGNVLVTFSQGYIDSVTIVYYEASGAEDPSARGIGLFGGLKFNKVDFKPTNLLKYGVALDDACQPIVRWVTEHEFGVSEYEVEYSYDGYNFSRAGAVEARNQYTDELEYEMPLFRKLNTDNYFRLVKTDRNGDRKILAVESMSGAECFNISTVNVYPNPSSGNYVFVEIEATEQKVTNIAIIDQNGAILVKTQYELKKGQNVFKLSSRHLVPGIYSLQFSVGDEIVTKRVSIVE